MEQAVKSTLCPYCKEDIKEGAIKCRHCNEVLEKDDYSGMVNERETISMTEGELTPYYQKIFAEFDANNGTFKPTWNWPAFLFGTVWYIYRGPWLKGLVLIIPITIMFLFFPWGLIAGLYSGIFGNYDYYLLKAKGKHFW